MKPLKHIRAIASLPIMVIVVVPGVLTYLTGFVNIGWSLSPPFDLILPFLGFILIYLGLILMLMVKTISLLASPPLFLQRRRWD